MYLFGALKYFTPQGMHLWQPKKNEFVEWKKDAFLTNSFCVEKKILFGNKNILVLCETQTFHSKAEYFSSMSKIYHKRFLLVFRKHYFLSNFRKVFFFKKNYVIGYIMNRKYTKQQKLIHKNCDKLCYFIYKKEF